MIILGSSSPRRKELMYKITDNFKIIVPLFNEKNLSPNLKNYALEESFHKALSLKDKINKEDCLITVDTIVYFNNQIYGKPKNIDEARKFLSTLSNNTHEVISGYTIFYNGITIKREVITKVTFSKLTESQINNYLKSINVLDKAGAYSIQDDTKFHFIKKIDGSFYNVMGLPIEKIKEDLINLKLI